MTPSVVVAGYASSDRTVLVDTPPVAGQTSRVVREFSRQRAGGIAYLAEATAGHGISTAAVTWVGADDIGSRYVSTVAASGIQTSGIERAGKRSPSATIYCTDDGTATCIYDPGETSCTLTDAQRGLLGRSTHAVVMIGPPDATNAVLDQRTTAQHLTWIIKGDRAAMPDALVDRLVKRSSLIFCNRDEYRQFRFGRVAPGTTMVVTDGHRPIEILRAGQSQLIDVPRPILEPTDSTGAGDTFAGATLARLIGEMPLEQAVVEASLEVADLLRRRS